MMPMYLQQCDFCFSALVVVNECNGPEMNFINNECNGPEMTKLTLRKYMLLRKNVIVRY